MNKIIRPNFLFNRWLRARRIEAEAVLTDADNYPASLVRLARQVVDDQRNRYPCDVEPPGAA